MKQSRVLSYCLLIISIFILSPKTNAQCPTISDMLNHGYIPGSPFYIPGHGNLDEFGVVDNEEFYVKIGSYPPIKAFRKTDACGTYYYSSYDTDNDRFPLDFDMTENQPFVVKTYKILYENSTFINYIAGCSVAVTPPSASEVGSPQDFLMKYDGTPHQVAWNLGEHPWGNYVSNPQYYIPQQDLTVGIIGQNELLYNESKEFIADINGGAGLYNIKWYLRDFPNGPFTEVKSTPGSPDNWESNYYKLFQPYIESFYFYDDEYKYNLTMQGHDVELKVVVEDYETNYFSAEASIVISSIPAITLQNNIENSDDFGYLFLKNNSNNNTYLIASGNSSPSLDFGTNYIVRTNELPFLVDWGNTGETEKHNRWLFDNPTKPPTYELSHGFTFQTSTDHTMKATFNPTIQVVLKNIIDGCDIGGGKIRFKDPWRYYQDQSGHWQQSDQFLSYDANLELFNNSENSYGGVFKNQPLSSNSHYSVESPTNNLFSTGRPLYFQNWTGTNVQFQNSIASQTGVVFTDDNAVVKANLKGHLLSGAQLGTNGQCHLVRDNEGYYNMFYVSMDKLWYTRSLTTTMNGAWDDELSLFEEDAKSVSIDIDGDLINIVFEGKSGSNYKIFRASLDVSTWEIVWPEGLADISSSYYGNAYPVVAASENQRFYVYRKSSSGGLYYIRQYYDGIWHTSSETTVPNTGFTSLNPAACMGKLGTFYDAVHLVYQDLNLNTYIRYTHWSTGTFSTPVTISEFSGYSINTNPSISPVKKDKGNGLFRYDPIVSWLGRNSGTLGKTDGTSIPTPRLIARACIDWEHNSWGETRAYGEEVNATQNASVDDVL